MKVLQLSLTTLAAAISAVGFLRSPAFGQQSPELIVQKEASYQQTSATAVAPSSSTPYSFFASVSEPSTIPTPTLTSPGGGTQSFSYNATDQQWETSTTTAATIGALDAIDPSGIYALDVNGVTSDLNLTGDAFSDTPILTLGGGHWSAAAGGEYVIAANQTLTINSNIFTDSSPAVVNSVALLDGVGEYPGQFGAIGDALSYSVAPNSLQAGNLLDLSVSFAAITGEQFDTSGDLVAVAGYLEETDIRLKVVGATVPDTFSTGAALAAGLALLGIFWKWKDKKALWPELPYYC